MNALSLFRPLMLAALAFVAVPLLIHFFSRRRTERLRFSSVRFLRDSAVTASRRKRLRQILLLLTRISLVVVLVLLFAQPYNRSDPFGILRNPQGRTFVWVDPTVSMDYTVDGETLWQMAYRRIDALDTVLPPGHRLFLFDHCVCEFAKKSEVPAGPCSGVRHGETDLNSALGEFRRLLNTGPHLPSLILVSDFQECDAGIVDTFFTRDSIFFPVVCVMAGARNPYNFSVSVASAPGRHASVVGCMVKTSGRGLSGSGLSVFSGTLRTGHALVECPPDSMTAVNVETSQAGDALYGEVRLETPDPFMHDNTAYFVAESRKGIRVLIVSEDESAFPVAAAFRSLCGGVRYEPRQVRMQEAGFEQVDSADVVVLAGITRAPQGAEALFSRSSLERKVVLFSPSAAEDGIFFRDRILRHMSGNQQSMMKRADKPLFPVLPDTVSFVWRGFPGTFDKTVEIGAYLAPLPGAPLVRLSNGEALCTYAVDSTGHCWIISAVPLGIDRTNNLAETGFYVPFLDRLVRFGLSQVRRREPEWTAGYMQRNPYAGSGVTAEVFDSEQRPVAQWANQRMAGFEMPGVYRIQPYNEAPYWVAVECAAQEGVMTYRKPRIPRSVNAYVKVLDFAGFDAFCSAVKGNSRLNFLWVLLGVLGAGEVALWGWKRHRIQPPSRPFS